MLSAGDCYGLGLITGEFTWNIGIKYGDNGFEPPSMTVEEGLL